ncbi:hypothetical protein PRIPAC_96210 [Pristionchus pacificus]|uniref:Uncharacterized protein n=1 Tax=Pristionchus pacificus TaxID=54126 RepID=A0A2A6BJQ9_PRIPA|nr:hypothetical protein PRIPAC_96210 [Pristionchus pacificus]|eukprot:PDM66073.1 hypothetical protein PRIPAC_45298 [Pristionchus pacificus]
MEVSKVVTEVVSEKVSVAESSVMEATMMTMKTVMTVMSYAIIILQPSALPPSTSLMSTA